MIDKQVQRNNNIYVAKNQNENRAGDQTFQNAWKILGGLYRNATASLSG